MKFFPLLFISACLLQAAFSAEAAGSDPAYSTVATGSTVAVFPAAVAGRAGVRVKNPAVPMVVDCPSNLAAVIEIDAPDESTFIDYITVAVDGLPRQSVKKVSLMYSNFS